MTKAEVKDLQRDLNAFTSKFLTKFPKLIVDGDRGHATNRRIQTVKWYLGYTGKPQRSSRLTPLFRRRLAHPKKADLFTKAMLHAGEERRLDQRREANQAPKSGLSTFDGRKVAAWMVPYLEWARKHGWKGTLVSGWRDPAYSEQLCLRMCGAPTCPGRCAGRLSGHVGKTKPNGSVDVSDYVRFGSLMRSAPFNPKLKNLLGARDPVHFSVSGR